MAKIKAPSLAQAVRSRGGKLIKRTITDPDTEPISGGKFVATTADMYGIPAMIIDAVTAPNDIMDIFGSPQFDNRPIHAYELQTEAGPEACDISFPEGECPDSTEHAQHRFALSAKSIGVETPAASYVALAAKQNVCVSPRTIVTREGSVSINSEWQYQLYVTLRAARTGTEWQILNGNPLNVATQFEGLDRAIRAPAAGRLDVNGAGVTAANSVVWENNGNRITVDRLYQMIGALEANYVYPGDIIMIMTSGMANEIARLISLNYADPGSERQALMRRKTFPLYGFEIPYRTTQWIGSTGIDTTEYQSTIYFVTPVYFGQPVMWMEYFDFSELVTNSDLFANPYGQMGAQPAAWYMVPADHGSYCTSTQFALWTHGRLFYQVPQALGRINDASYEFINERTVTC